MQKDYWRKQTADEPLFPELLWSRPENKCQAGKLLIIGGNAQGFVAPAAAFRAAEAAGIGTARMVLPDSLTKFVGQNFTGGVLAASTPSGSFARESLGIIIEEAAWADGTLLAGNLGHNSETAIIIETFTDKYSGQLTLVGDSLDYFLHLPESILMRASTTLVAEFAQLQQLITAAKFDTAITSGMDLLHFVEVLHRLTGKFSANLIVVFADNICVAVGEQVSTTKIQTKVKLVDLAAQAATWWLQSPNKPFEALSSAVGDASDPHAQT